MIKEKVKATLRTIGIGELQAPIFYRSPVGIRFKIEDDSLPASKENYEVNEEYVESCLNKAWTLWKDTTAQFDVLVFQVHENGEDAGDILTKFQQITGISLPIETRELEINEDGFTFYETLYYWDLTKTKLDTNGVLSQIIKSDLDGHGFLTSSVYFFDTLNDILFYLYDDRGLDIAAGKVEKLSHLYKEYGEWILEYDRERIDAIFEGV